jgi:hypothetical protein
VDACSGWASVQKEQRRMGIGLETLDTFILEMGGSFLALGLVLLTGGVVGALLVRRQYGAVLPLSLLLAAVALLLWGGPAARVLVSFLLLLIGYTWLLAWWRACQQRRDRVSFHRPRSRKGDAAPASGGGTCRGKPGVHVARDTQPERSQEVTARLEETRGGRTAFPSQEPQVE